MNRNLVLFPNDKTGDVLWEMQQTGDDLEQPREVEFSVLFPTQALAIWK
ncbi:MAG: hypothetical protein COB83_00560 [Gammaproteobacteria bacterium]|nr:MAG: hypothetical protein COB83_00560 [Gammaproteobacteria bacterium]